MEIEQFIENTNRAKTTDEVFSLFESALKELGYDRICYSLLTDHPSLGLPAGHGVMRNYSEDWMKHYTENEYINIDPVPQYSFSSNRPFTWNWLINTVEMAPNQKQVMHEAREAKLLDGVGIPLYGINGEIAGVGLASSSGKTGVDKDMLCKIRALAFQFHLSYTEKDEVDGDLIDIHLTQREQEILLWAAEGKSDPSIAEIIGVSYPTVRYHMNNIFRKLNANERTFAVVKAIRHGLIHPSFVSELPSTIRLVR